MTHRFGNTYFSITLLRRIISKKPLNHRTFLSEKNGLNTATDTRESAQP